MTDTPENLLRSIFCVSAVLGILMYSTVHSGSCAPATRKLSSLATVFRGALDVTMLR